MGKIKLYDANEIEEISKIIPIYVKEIEEKILEKYEPTRKEIESIHDIIMSYVQKNRLKIRGGLSIDILLRQKGGKIYDNPKLSDIDLFSVNPLRDIINIAQELHNKNYKHVNVINAIHEDTYVLRVNTRSYCDITYIPKNIYSKLPFIEIKELHLVRPLITFIDYLLAFSDPINSSFKWKAYFSNFHKLMTAYPIITKHNTHHEYFKPNPALEKVRDKINKLLRDNPTMIITGLCTYDIYNDIYTGKRNAKRLSNIIEIITSQYEEDTSKILYALSTENTLNVIEKYPFAIFRDFTAEIQIDGITIIKIYKQMPNMCIPTYQYDGYNIGSFQYNLRTILVNAIYDRVQSNAAGEMAHLEIATELLKIREEYFRKYKKTYLDPGLFRDFGWQCIGESQHPTVFHSIRVVKKRKKIQKFVPGVQKLEDIDWNNWFYLNSSGNSINNTNNLRILFQYFVN